MKVVTIVKPKPKVKAKAKIKPVKVDRRAIAKTPSYEAISMEHFSLPGNETEIFYNSVKKLMAKGGVLSGRFTGSDLSVESFDEFSLSYEKIMITFKRITRRVMIRISGEKTTYLRCGDPIYSLCGFEEYDLTLRDLTVVNSSLDRIRRLLVTALPHPYKIASLNKAMNDLMERVDLEEIEGLLGDNFNKINNLVEEKLNWS